MSLVVEDGTGLANAESYASVAQMRAYAPLYGYTVSGEDTDQEVALRRATQWLDNAYRGQFPGYRKRRRLQALEWPRIGAYTHVPDNGGGSPFLTFAVNAEEYAMDPFGGDYYGFDYISSESVPVEIVNATIEAALRELTTLVATPGSSALMPDLPRGGAIKKEQAGDTSLEYFGSAPVTTVIPTIAVAISPVLLRQSGVTARAMRS